MVAGNCLQGKSCMQGVKEAALPRVKLKSSIGAAWEGIWTAHRPTACLQHVCVRTGSPMHRLSSQILGLFFADLGPVLTGSILYI